MSQYKWRNYNYEYIYHLDQSRSHHITNYENPLETLTNKIELTHNHKHARENQDKKNELSNQMPHILYT